MTLYKKHKDLFRNLDEILSKAVLDTSVLSRSATVHCDMIKIYNCNGKNFAFSFLNDEEVMVVSCKENDEIHSSPKISNIKESIKGFINLLKVLNQMGILNHDSIIQSVKNHFNIRKTLSIHEDVAKLKTEFKEDLSKYNQLNTEIQELESDKITKLSDLREELEFQKLEKQYEEASDKIYQLESELGLNLYKKRSEQQSVIHTYNQRFDQLFNHLITTKEQRKNLFSHFNKTRYQPE